MTAKATLRIAALAMKGAFFVPVKSTSHSLNTPAIIATMLFIVVIMPKIELRLLPATSRFRL